MFGITPRVNPLELRKQLLVAESDINRVQLAADVGALSEGVRTISGRVKSVVTITSAVVALMSGLLAFQGGKTAKVETKPGWFATILENSSLIASVWQMFRSSGNDRKG